MLGFNSMASVLLPETEKNAIARSVLYLFCGPTSDKCTGIKLCYVIINLYSAPIHAMYSMLSALLVRIALFKEHVQEVKRNVFKFFLKDSFVSHIFNFGGRVFHKTGATDSNERAPKYFLMCPSTLGILRSAWDASPTP